MQHKYKYKLQTISWIWKVSTDATDCVIEKYFEVLETEVKVFWGIADRGRSILKHCRPRKVELCMHKWRRATYYWYWLPAQSPTRADKTQHAFPFSCRQTSTVCGDFDNAHEESDTSLVARERFVRFETLSTAIKLCNPSFKLASI